MKHIKKYNLFCEGYEEIMDDMVKDVDFNQIEKSNEEIEKLRQRIDIKKTELEKSLDLLDKLQIEGFSEDNKDLLKEKKEIITTTIEKLKEELKNLEVSIQTIKDNISKIKETK